LSYVLYTLKTMYCQTTGEKLHLLKSVFLQKKLKKDEDWNFRSGKSRFEL